MKIAMSGSKKLTKKASNLALFGLCVLYGLSSSALTLSNKSVFAIFGDVSPMNLLMLQCICNVVFCLTLMTIKEVNVSSFSKLKSYGLVIPELNKIADKVQIGVRVGLANLLVVISGFFAIKFCPMSL